MVAAQADAAAPIVRAFEAGADAVGPIEAGATSAESIKSGKPSPLATRCLAEVKASDGAAVGVTDEELLAAQRLLARTCGIFGEPGGVASVAAALKLKAEGKIQEDDLVVCTVSGHGLKQVDVLKPAALVVNPIPATVAALKKRVKELAK
jgi:threonine synthase